MIQKVLPLGEKTTYSSHYDPSLLFPIPRSLKREEIGLGLPLPFTGVDIWNGYELSWLNEKGKPVVATAEFRFPADSPFLIESKSFKLYLNSFNQTIFSTRDVKENLERDLTKACGKEVLVILNPPFVTGTPGGYLLDDLDISVNRYTLSPEFLSADGPIVQETLLSHLLKSNCLVTNQPDWGTLIIRYEGRTIEKEGLLKYIISFREHNEFHEQCVERIFSDILRRCEPEKLTVYARYTRRGGLDINPFRSNFEEAPLSVRLIRQ